MAMLEPGMSTINIISSPINTSLSVPYVASVAFVLKQKTVHHEVTKMQGRKKGRADTFNANS